jgi:hypothetical protein
MAVEQRSDFGGVFYTTATVDAAAMAANDSADETVTVSGVLSTDIVLAVIPPSNLDDDVVVSHAYVSAADTVVVRIANVGAGTPNPASGTWGFVIGRR